MALRRIVLLSLLLLTLAGCYRQADEGFQPVSIPTEGDGQTTPAPVITTMPTGTFASSSATTDEAPATDEGSVTEPTDAGASVDTTNAVEPITTQPLIITIEPTETSLPDLIQPTDTQSPDETSVFITPGSPQGPVIIETSTPSAAGDATSTPSGLITPTDFFNREDGETCEYVIQRGDTISTIASRNNLSTAQLLEANPNVDPDFIIAGDVLLIPGCGEGTEDTAAEPTATEVQAVDGQTIHVVARGESLYTIAREYGVTVQDIVDANQLSNPNRIDIGQRLIIPTED